MTRFIRLFAIPAVCLTGLTSCRLALHTLPESVGRQDFALQAERGEAVDVFSCDGVLYVRVTGSFSRPPVALMEQYDLKYGDWVFVPKSGKKTEEASQVSFFLPMDAESVRLWNTMDDNQAPLRFEKYQAGVLTEEEMAAKGGIRVAKGKICGCELFKKYIQEAAVRRNWAHYALMPISLTLEAADTVSAIPLTAAAIAGAVAVVPVGIAVTGLGELTQQQQTSAAPSEQSPD